MIMMDVIWVPGIGETQALMLALLKSGCQALLKVSGVEIQSESASREMAVWRVLLESHRTFRISQFAAHRGQEV